MPRLSPRLHAVARLLPTCVRAADIGTDHALLPTWLVCAGRVERAIAADIANGPLTRAQATVERFDVGGEVELRQANGLLALQPGEVECVAIAGMGPGRMIEILTGAPEVVARLDAMVLQPNHGGEQLRRHLVANGWNLSDEQLVEDRGHFYTAMQWRKGSSSAHVSWRREDWLFGPWVVAHGGEVLRRLLERESARASRDLARKPLGSADWSSLRSHVNWLAQLQQRLFPPV